MLTLIQATEFLNLDGIENKFMCCICDAECFKICLEIYIVPQQTYLICSYCKFHENDNPIYEVLKTFNINDDLNKVKSQIKKIIML